MLLSSSQRCRKPSCLADSPPPLRSQVVLSFAFQEPEHLVKHQITVCLSVLLVEGTETLHLRSHPFCFHTLVGPVFPPRLHQVTSTKEVLPRKFFNLSLTLNKAQIHGTLYINPAGTECRMKRLQKSTSETHRGAYKDIYPDQSDLYFSRVSNSLTRTETNLIFNSVSVKTIFSGCYDS